MAITEQQRLYGAKYRAENREKVNARKRAQLLELKVEVFAHYGGSRCSMCPETRLGALGLNHILGGGKTHRKEIGPGQFYRWIRDHNYPPDFRVLCSNCNIIAHLERLQNVSLSMTHDAVKLRKRYADAKQKMMEMLGGSCVICRKSDLRILTVHHVQGDGAAHRKKISRGNADYLFYREVMKTGNTQGLECRCFSCNDAAV